MFLHRARESQICTRGQMRTEFLEGAVSESAQDVPELISFCVSLDDTSSWEFVTCISSRRNSGHNHLSLGRGLQAITEVSPLTSGLSTILPGMVAPSGGDTHFR